MPDVTGTLRKLTIEGISFNVAADADISEVMTNYEVTRIPTSGPSMKKMVRRIPAREGIVLITNAAERENLKSFAEQIADVKVSYTNAAGDEYKCEGSIEVENNTTQENRTTVRVDPKEDWTAFIA